MIRLSFLASIYSHQFTVASCASAQNMRVRLGGIYVLTGFKPWSCIGPAFNLALHQALPGYCCQLAGGYLFLWWSIWELSSFLFWNLTATVLLQRSQVTSLFGAKRLWKKGFTGVKVRMAIFDTGIRANHPHFRNIKVVSFVIRQKFPFSVTYETFYPFLFTNNMLISWKAFGIK